MVRYSFLFHQPYIFLLFSTFSFLLALFGTITGIGRIRHRGFVYRNKDPKAFRWAITWWCLCGTLSLGLFFHKC